MFAIFEDLQGNAICVGHTSGGAQADLATRPLGRQDPRQA
jgi:hypothetical protein